MSLDTGPEIGAAVGGGIGAALLAIAGIFKVFSGKDGEKKGEEVLDKLLRNQNAQAEILIRLSRHQEEYADILKKLSLILEVFLDQQKDMHMQNNREISNLREGQRDIAGAIRNSPIMRGQGGLNAI